jgi:hypothetical protein
MAQVTRWLKRIGRPPRWHRIMFKMVHRLNNTCELWLTDPENRVLRCALDPSEAKTLYEELGKFFERVG